MDSHGDVGPRSDDDEAIREARGAVLFAGVLVAGCVGAVVMALDFTGRASTAPLTIGLPAVAMSVVVLVRDTRRWLHLRDTATGRPAGPGWGERLRGNPYVWLVVFLLGFYGLGALWSLVVFSLALMLLRGQLPWVPVVLVTVGTSLAFYLVVEILLREELYTGVFL